MTSAAAASTPSSGAAAEEPPPRRLYRSWEGRVLGGVARGLAGHLGVPVSWVRTVFLVLFCARGLGALLYAVFWFVLPLGTEQHAVPASGGARPPRRRGRELVVPSLLLVAGVLVLGGTLRYGAANAYLWPLLLIGLGVAVVWRQADNSRLARWAPRTFDRGRLLLVARSLAGLALVVTGVSGIVLLEGWSAQVGTALRAALAVVVGVALLAGPYLARIVQDLAEERLMRIRAQARAELAAHVHDSVLHTLTLIQKHAGDPREVARLARAQERELRAWLYRPQGHGGDESAAPRTLADAVRGVAAEVEDAHGVPVEVVCVGDCPLDERLTAQLQAAREAMVNAAKYGGEGGPVQVYSEVEGRRVFLSVRDRGPGFDLDAVPPDRMGVRESIIGRMRRNGGTARLRTVPDGGTEVELEMERAVRDEDD